MSCARLFILPDDPELAPHITTCSPSCTGARLERKRADRRKAGLASVAKQRQAKAAKRRAAPPRRLWADARAKVDREGECRLHGGRQGECDGRLEAAHVLGRRHDETPIEGREHLWERGWYVAPERVIPLCSLHHRLFDAHQVDVLGRLHLAEELQAVVDARSRRRATAWRSSSSLRSATSTRGRSFVEWGKTTSFRRFDGCSAPPTPSIKGRGER